MRFGSRSRTSIQITAGWQFTYPGPLWLWTPRRQVRRLGQGRWSPSSSRRGPARWRRPGPLGGVPVAELRPTDAQGGGRGLRIKSACGPLPRLIAVVIISAPTAPSSWIALRASGRSPLRDPLREDVAAGPDREVDPSNPCFRSRPPPRRRGTSPSIFENITRAIDHGPLGSGSAPQLRPRAYGRQRSSTISAVRRLDGPLPIAFAYSRLIFGTLICKDQSARIIDDGPEPPGVEGRGGVGGGAPWVPYPGTRRGTPGMAARSSAKLRRGRSPLRRRPARL